MDGGCRSLFLSENMKVCGALLYTFLPVAEEKHDNNIHL